MAAARTSESFVGSGSSNNITFNQCEVSEQLSWFCRKTQRCSLRKKTFVGEIEQTTRLIEVMVIE